MKERYYLRYCDDFIILSDDKQPLICTLIFIRQFLSQNLLLDLHPKKVTIRKLSQGIDFIGYVLFERHTLVRARTIKRMKQRLKTGFVQYISGKTDAVSLDQKLQSYLGILSHANQYELSEALKNAYWVRESS